MNTMTRAIVSAARTLHVYLSMLGLAMMFFFAATGFMLNHAGWFESEEARMRTMQGHVSGELLGIPQKDALAEHLRGAFGIRGELTSLDVDDRQVTASFSSPGRRARAIIDRSDGAVEVVFEDDGPVQRLLALHKGKDAGGAWRRVIDAASLLLMFSAISGAVLWLSLPHRRRIGLAALAVSVVICVAVYLALVP